MLVRFKKDWYGPGEHLRQQVRGDAPATSGPLNHLYPRTYPHSPAVQLPEELRPLMHPSFATIVGPDDKPEVLPPEETIRTLGSFDESAAEDAVYAKADAARAALLQGARKPPRSV